MIALTKEECIGAQTYGEAYRLFTRTMLGKQYGREETLDAWLWFLAGWKAKCDQRKGSGKW